MKKTLIGAAAAALALPFSAVLLASPGQCRSGGTWIGPNNAIVTPPG
jgi:hypothetical protein